MGIASSRLESLDESRPDVEYQECGRTTPYDSIPHRKLCYVADHPGRLWRVWAPDREAKARGCAGYDRNRNRSNHFRIWPLRLDRTLVRTIYSGVEKLQRGKILLPAAAAVDASVRVEPERAEARQVGYACRLVPDSYSGPCNHEVRYRTEEQCQIARGQDRKSTRL